MKVVVIDDDPSILSLLQTLLRRRGYTVLAYHTPLECPLYHAKSCPCEASNPCPDVLISDLDMPDVNGMQLIEDIHARGCLCKHVAIITGQGLQEQDMRRMAKFGTRFFLKPVEFDELYAWIDRVVKRPNTPAT